ncbi:MAG: hypothetical protein V1923_05430 [Candidatus Omnitrophota bacterium]
MAQDVKFSRRARSKLLGGAVLIFFFLAPWYLDKLDSWAAFAQEEGVEELQDPEFVPPPFSIERPIVEYEAGNLRDPFQGTAVRKDIKGPTGPTDVKISAKAKRPLPLLAIQGVVWGGNFPQAIIENRVVKVGDLIKLGQAQEAAKIIGIDQEGVLILFEGQSYKLPPPAKASTSSKKPSGG